MRSSQSESPKGGISGRRGGLGHTAGCRCQTWGPGPDCGKLAFAACGRSGLARLDSRRKLGLWLNLTEKKRALGVGRPTFLERCRIALCEAVQSDMPCVPDLQPEMPKGLRPGQSLLRTCVLEPALEVVAAISGSEDEEEPLRRARSCLQRPSNLSGSLSKFRRAAKAGLGRRLWSTCAPFRQISSVTCTTTPSSIGSATGSQAETGKGSVRPMLSAGVVLRLCQVFQRVFQEVPMTTTVLAEVANLELASMGAGVEVSREWVRRKPRPRTRSCHQRWSGTEIPWERVVNVDQTCPHGRGLEICRLPNGPAQGRENPIHCLPGIWHPARRSECPADLCRQDREGAPDGTCQPGITVTHILESLVIGMMRLVEEVDQLLNPGDVKAPWMLLLDVCPLHVSTAFGTLMCDTCPHVCRCHVNSGTTGVCVSAAVLNLGAPTRQFHVCRGGGAPWASPSASSSAGGVSWQTPGGRFKAPC